VKENLVQAKSLALAIKIIGTYKALLAKREFVMSRQLLRSGTSIGANIEEAIGAQSRADFISKMSISYKEARETVYWIKLLSATEYLSKETSDSLMDDVQELCRIIGKIQISSKKAT
jgi:four helix bundle protein